MSWTRRLHLMKKWITTEQTVITDMIFWTSQGFLSHQFTYLISSLSSSVNDLAIDFRSWFNKEHLRNKIPKPYMETFSKLHGNYTWTLIKRTPNWGKGGYSKGSHILEGSTSTWKVKPITLSYTSSSYGPLKRAFLSPLLGWQMTGILGCMQEKES